MSCGNSFVSALSLDEGMVVTLVRSAAGYSSRDVPEEDRFFLVVLLHVFQLGDISSGFG